MKNDFNEFRFKGLDYRKFSNKYLTMKRISDDETKVVIKVDDVHLLETRYGYAFILDKKHVVFLKEWQVNRNFYGNEVLLDKDYFQVKEWGDFENFLEDEKALDYSEYVGIAKEQINNQVQWAMY